MDIKSIKSYRCDDTDYETPEGSLKALVRLVYEATGLKESVECEIKVYYRK